MSIRRVYSGAPWENKVAYCRAIRLGNWASISGTTSVDENGNLFGKGNAYLQTKRCFEIVQKALKQLDLPISAVIRTRMFVTDISKWEEYGRAHQEFFSQSPPTTTMLEVKALINPEMLIEVEADALVES